jgi:hypothetical protein
VASSKFFIYKRKNCRNTTLLSIDSIINSHEKKDARLHIIHSLLRILFLYPSLTEIIPYYIEFNGPVMAFMKIKTVQTILLSAV